MKPIIHTVDLWGPVCSGSHIDSVAAGRVLHRLPHLIRNSVRMAVMRSSTVQGRAPADLARAWKITYTGLGDGPRGATRFRFEASRLQDAAPKLFDQMKLALYDESAHPDDTGFDIVGRMVGDVAQHRRESELFDPSLLAYLKGFNSTLKEGIETIHLNGHKLKETGGVGIDAKVTEAATLLFDQTPPPRRIRVTGTLDMIRMSDRVFELVLPDGKRLRAVWAAETPAHLADYLSREVVIEGLAIYRPSQALLRVDASAIAIATAQDRHFASLPAVHAVTTAKRSYQHHQSSSNGINRLWGIWPGEETEEELLLLAGEA